MTAGAGSLEKNVQMSFGFLRVMVGRLW